MGRGLSRWLASARRSRLARRHGTQRSSRAAEREGIRTEVLWEHVDAGEGIDDVAQAFDLAISDVRWALACENSLHAAA